MPITHDLSEVIKALEMIEPPKKQQIQNVENKSANATFYQDL